MRRYEILVFLSGAVTLSLEVLASRIMTPYFGVSLYIWAGILSITLAFLAIGYHLGGVVSRRLNAAELEALLVTTPAASASAIAFATLIYPAVLPGLAGTSLVFGSFIGALLLLGLPLIALSAMNPLLIALQRTETAGGDGGAGRVFFISTIGSVAGVLFTAFLFIPNITNFRASLILAITLCVLCAGFALLAPSLGPRRKRRLITFCVVIAALTGALAVAKKSYLEFLTVAAANPLNFELLAEYTSIFGNVKVADVREPGSSEPLQRLLVNDGLVQNRTVTGNISISLYTHMLEALIRTYAPSARKLLVLGLGAGIVPRNLARNGLDVTVVEINPSMMTAATNYFGFDPERVKLVVADARTFVHRCRNDYDAVVVDLFLGDNIPDYLLSQEFFGDLAECLRPGGAIAMNGFSVTGDDRPTRRIAATIKDAFPHLLMTGLEDGSLFFVGLKSPPPANIAFEVPQVPGNLRELIWQLLRRNRTVNETDLAGVEPVTDDHNIYSVLFAPSDMQRRGELVSLFPPKILVN